MSPVVTGGVVVFLGTKAGLKLGRIGLKYIFLSVVVFGLSVVYVFVVVKVLMATLGVLGFFLTSIGTF